MILQIITQQSWKPGYPEIGRELPFAIATLKTLEREGHRLILWSVREGRLLDERWILQGPGTGILCGEPELSGGKGRT